MSDAKMIISAFAYNDIYSKDSGILINTPVTDSDRVRHLETKLKTAEAVIEKLEKAVEFASAEDMWYSDGEYIERFTYQYEEWYQDKLRATLQEVREMKEDK